MIPAPCAPLASHLWQSTLFAGVVGLLTLALRRNQARVRYWLWLTASYKFLLPFSWLVSIGHQFEWRAAPTIMPPAFSVVVDAVNQPSFPDTASRCEARTRSPACTSLGDVGSLVLRLRGRCRWVGP